MNMNINPNIVSLDRIVYAIEHDDHMGFCLVCGADCAGCEPDAREYECPDCAQPTVYGAEECLLMI